MTVTTPFESKPVMNRAMCLRACHLAPMRFLWPMCAFATTYACLLARERVPQGVRAPQRLHVPFCFTTINFGENHLVGYCATFDFRWM